MYIYNTYKIHINIYLYIYRGSYINIYSYIKITTFNGEWTVDEGVT